MFLAARKLEDIAVHERIELHVAARPLKPGAYLITGKRLVLTAEYQLAGGIDVEELALGVLEDAADKGRRVVELRRSGTDAIHIDGAFHLALIEIGSEPVDQAREGRLAATALTDEHSHSPVSDLQVDMADAVSCAILAAIVETHVIETNHRHAFLNRSPAADLLIGFS